jgi:hypothetical protein
VFSLQQKREIAEKIQRILRETNHPELPSEEIKFQLHVEGAEAWSWADIRNNGAVVNPGINPWNEAQAKVEVMEISKEELLEGIQKLSEKEAIQNKKLLHNPSSLEQLIQAQSAIEAKIKAENQKLNSHLPIREQLEWKF